MSTTRLIPASGILLGPGRRAVVVPLRSELGTTAYVLGGEWGGWGVVTDERVKLGEIIKKSFPTHKTSSSGLNLL